MKKIEVLFYLEHKSRELETVKSIVKKANIKRYRICSTAFFMGISKFLYRPRLIITPWLYNSKDYYSLASFPFVRKLNILNLHHEQITNKDRITALLPSGYAKKGFHVSWGPEFSTQLINAGVAKEKIYETGSIRLSHLEKSFNEQFDIVSERNKLSEQYLRDTDIGKQWVLFASSFSWKDLSDSQLEKIEKKGRERVWEYRDLVCSSYKVFLEWVEILLNNNTNIVYIYRLHPSESKDDRLLFLEKTYKNFHTVYERPISDWIAAVDSVDLWISTSIAEVFKLKKPVRIIRPIQLPANVEIFGFEDFVKVHTIEGFLDTSSEKYFVEPRFYLEKFYSGDKDAEALTAEAVKTILSTEPDEIDIPYYKKLAYATKEACKDVVKIVSVKLRLTFISRVNRISKSFFTKEEQ